MMPQDPDRLVEEYRREYPDLTPDEEAMKGNFDRNSTEPSKGDQ